MRLVGSARAGAVVSLALVAWALAGCHVGEQIVAPTDDLTDYRAFRMAAHPGTRLARAQQYLEAHPNGTWADEVRGAFEKEEPEYFERAQGSREKAREYLVDLPRGPHADAALAILVEYDSKVEDLETARLMRGARRTEALLDNASNQRRVVGERVLGHVAALADPVVYGAPITSLPEALRVDMEGPAKRTWGRMPLRREEEVFFSLPAKRERESRVASVAVALAVEGDRVLAGWVEGPDLFTRWAEADLMKPLDAGQPGDRSLAGKHVAEVLGGALEGRFPAAKCGPPGGLPSLRVRPLLPKVAARAPRGRVVFARACEGLRIEALQGDGPGEGDVVTFMAEELP